MNDPALLQDFHPHLIPFHWSHNHLLLADFLLSPFPSPFSQVVANRPGEASDPGGNSNTVTMESFLFKLPGQMMSFLSGYEGD